MTENQCIKAHPTCKAGCCKYVGFTYPKNALTQEQKEYYEMHEGIIVTRKFDGRNIWDYVMVKAKCKHLQKDLTCAIYENRPKICREGYQQIKKGVMYMPGCIHDKPKNATGLTTQEINRIEEKEETKK